MLKQGFSTPKLYTYAGDTDKEWYVGFRFTCPTRQVRKPFQIRAGINYVKTTKERELEGAAVVKLVKESLAAGWNPFDCDLKGFLEKQTPPAAPDDPALDLTAMPFNKALQFAQAKKKPSIKESSYDQYDMVIGIALKAAEKIGLDKMPISATKKQHIKLLLEQMAQDRQAAYDEAGNGQKFTPNSYNKYLLYLSNHFDELEEWEAVEYNPCNKIKLKDEIETGRHRHATDEELVIIKAKLPAWNQELYNFMRFEYVTGMRPKEILLTTPDMIDRLNSVIKLSYTEGKTKVYREVPLPKFLLDWIDKRMEGLPGHLYIFSHKLRPGTILKKSAYVSTMWKRTVKTRFGLNVSLYSFKGAGGESKRGVGIDFTAVQTGWGHVPGSTATRRYLTKEGERLRKQIIAHAPDL